MPIAQFFSLKRVLSRLSQSEKRHFVLYINRLDSNKEVLFKKLFYAIDKNPEISEEVIYQKLKFQSQTQFTNAKRHLFSQIMKSLRLLLKDERPLIIRRTVDYAVILYTKGLYTEALALLEKATTLAQQAQLSILLLEILELRKKIESRHITRSGQQKNKITQLLMTANQTSELLNIESRMSNISFKIQGYYMLLGFAKDNRDALMYRLNFENLIPLYTDVEHSPTAKVLWHQSHVWFHYMSLDFENSFKQSVLWVHMMDAFPRLKDSDPDLYMRGLHYVLTNCFYLNDRLGFQEWYGKFKIFREATYPTYDVNSQLLDFCYYYNAELNYLLLFNQLTKIEPIETYINERIEYFAGSIDGHRILVFYYKLAMLFSYVGQYEKALDYLNRVLDRQENHLRKDIFIYARLLHLMCHYRIGNFALVQNLLVSVKATFESANKLNPVVEIMINFMKKGCRAMNFGIKELLSTTIVQLLNYTETPFHKVGFLYYDYTSWVRSIGMNTTIDKTRRKVL